MPTTRIDNSALTTDEVRFIQSALLARGIDPGPIDGKLGPRTNAAIIAFKVKKGMAARPWVGPLTMAALQDASGVVIENDSLPPWIKIGLRYKGYHEVYDNAALNIRGRHMLPRVQEMAANAHRLGVKIVAATDTGYGPNSTTTLAHELIELTNVGLSPLEALQAATTNAAELFGIEDRVGRIEPGLEADLIVLERNPLQGIEVVQDVLMVVSDGEVIVQRGDGAGRPVS